MVHHPSHVLVAAAGAVGARLADPGLASNPVFVGFADGLTHAWLGGRGACQLLAARAPLLPIMYYYRSIISPRPVLVGFAHGLPNR